MKKIIFLITLLIYYSTYALNPADYLDKISENFKHECYEYYKKIDRSYFEKNKTYKLESNLKIEAITQMWFNLALKETRNNYSEKYLYSIQNIELINNKGNDNNRSLQDDNSKTYVEYDTTINKSPIIIEFNKKIVKNSYKFDFNYQSNYYKVVYSFSNDWINYNLTTKQELKNHSFKYLKISFSKKWKTEISEKIKIYELSFSNTSKNYLIKSFFNDYIEVYSWYKCKQNYRTPSNRKVQFETDLNTKLKKIKLEKNPKFNVYTKKDKDNDWVEDDIDNCPQKYNPNQLDSNWDQRWDICSDDDKDWIIWYYDNCINIYNPKQTDVNRNSVWDKCEFDKDLDWIFDSVDNCITLVNSEQKDSDKDNIWDKCDNCKYFNPAQTDKDNNWIGDVCDQKKKYLEENDDDKDLIINSQDNCKYISNPNQEDFDKDWIWDICDNCKEIQNKKQTNSDDNNLWDMCDDSDFDNIIGYLDNCINVKNPDQQDSDNNWVWDMCEDNDSDNIIFDTDNCPYNYNPKQIDIDKDWIWDKCDNKDDRYIESNKDFFIWLLVIIVLLFWFWIFSMIKKLKN